MPVPDNWMTSPLSVIDTLFEQNAQLDDSAVTKYFTDKLESAEVYSKIPSINDVPLHNLTSGSLVRYRGMVQDIFDPEFFLGTYEVQRVKDGTTRLCTAMYRDIVSCAPCEEINFDSTRNVTCDRQTMYCIPIPGENTWAKQAYASIYKKVEISAEDKCQPSSSKRSLDCSEEMMCTSCPGETADSSCSMELTSGTSDFSETKKSKTSSETTPLPSTSTSSTDLNFPLPTERGPACLLKIYNTSSFTGKLNDVIEVVGILSVDPAMATFHTQTKNESETDLVAGIELMDSAEEQAVKNPPPSLVPRLHAVVIKTLDHSNPLLMPNLSRGCSVSEGNALQNVGTVRDETLAILEHAMLGDRLAAEYLLCHLVSSVYSRRDVMALGKFALNFSGCPRERGSDFVGHLANFLSGIVTKSHLLPMSLDNLNGVRFVPQKDYTANRLRSGLLQLSPGTHLFVDETTMQPGQLQAQGVNNLAALNSVVVWQRLDYDFEYHKHPFFTDLVVLVMSEGKSLLKCDCQLPLVYDLSAVANIEEKYNGIHTYLTPDLLQRIRTYLGHVQLLAYSVPDDVQKVIEQDFVERRRENAENLTVPDFHLLLTLARLLSLTSGETSLSEATWRQALAMESMRTERLKVTAPPC